MRFAFVPIVLLAASFSLVAAQSANIDPTPAPYKIDMMQRPMPVYVLNFPEVQTVEGTVTVSNLPAVQTVGGTVSVGNLPFDASGAVRVTGAPTPASPIVMHELFAGTLAGTPNCSCTIGANCVCADLPAIGIDTTGYSKIGAYVRGEPGQGGILYKLHWRWADDEPYTDADDDTLTQQRLACRGLFPNRMICANLGGEVSVHVEWQPWTGASVSNVRVYLIP